MSYFIAAAYVIAGLINFAPIMGVLSDHRVMQLYAVTFEHTDFSLLLRHRAVLLGIVGALVIAAAFHAPLRFSAGLAGLVSMLSYIVLMLMLNVGNENLLRVMWIDVFATLLLAAAFALDLASK